MASITLPTGTQHGAVGYPMVMTALSGIEVLGVLTSTATFKVDNGAARFGEFWRRYMYRDREAFQRLDSLVYEMVRHGLAHSFLAKPMIRVTKHRDRNHLCRVKGGAVFILDALTLADDLEIAYRERLRPEIKGQVRTNMEARFREFRETYWEDHVEWKDAFEKAPIRVDTLVFENLSTRENSRGPAIYSTSALRGELTYGPAALPNLDQ